MILFILVSLVVGEHSRAAFGFLEEGKWRKASIYFSESSFLLSLGSLFEGIKNQFSVSSVFLLAASTACLYAGMEAAKEEGKKKRKRQKHFEY